MNNLCVIPARGNSKRIPRKNIKDFLGKPIIAYSIETALNSGLFNHVIVSTDDQEIAEIATKYGAKVPFFRSSKNSDDFATTADVILEVINEYQKLNQKFDKICCIYPTAPFVNSEILKKSYDILIKNKVDCVFPIIEYSYPIQRALIMNERGIVQMKEKEFLNHRSQDLEKTFHDAGQFYFFDSESFIKTNKLWTNNTKAIQISELNAQDIDNITDWKIAELKYKLQNEIS